MSESTACEVERQNSYLAAPFCFVTRQREYLADAIVWSPVERGYNAFESRGHGCAPRRMDGSRLVLRLKVTLPVL